MLHRGPSKSALRLCARKVWSYALNMCYSDEKDWRGIERDEVLSKV